MSLIPCGLADRISMQASPFTKKEMIDFLCARIVNMLYIIYAPGCKVISLFHHSFEVKETIDLLILIKTGIHKVSSNSL